MAIQCISRCGRWSEHSALPCTGGWRQHFGKVLCLNRENSRTCLEVALILILLGGDRLMRPRCRRADQPDKIIVLDQLLLQQGLGNLIELVAVVGQYLLRAILRGVQEL